MSADRRYVAGFYRQIFTLPRNVPGMARLSLHQRFDIHSTAFLMVVLGDLMQ